MGKEGRMYLHADLTKTLRRIPWFAELSKAKLDCLASIATLHELEAGDQLFQEGDREDFLYVLLEGQVVLEIEVPTRGQVPIYTAEVLDTLGWSSMTPIVRQRTASARATQPCLLIGFNSKLLQQLCDDDCELGYIIMRRMANVVANRLLTTRICLLEMISQSVPFDTHIAP
jgi:CRP/FNR family transcriptional regulator, cyclic AMP receptor protein